MTSNMNMMVRNHDEDMEELRNLINRNHQECEHKKNNLQNVINFVASQVEKTGSQYHEISRALDKSELRTDRAENSLHEITKSIEKTEFRHEKIEAKLSSLVESIAIATQVHLNNSDLIRWLMKICGGILVATAAGAIGILLKR